MPVLRSAVRGDMYIQAVIETPVNLTKRQQELLREFEKAGEKEKTNPESEGFFARVKEFLRCASRPELATGTGEFVQLSCRPVRGSARRARS